MRGEERRGEEASEASVASRGSSEPLSLLSSLCFFASSLLLLLFASMCFVFFVRGHQR